MKTYKQFVTETIFKGTTEYADHRKFSSHARSLAKKMKAAHPNLDIRHEHEPGSHEHVYSHVTGEGFAHYDHKKGTGWIDHKNAKDPVYPKK